MALEKLPLLMMSAGSTVVTAFGHRYAMVSLAKAPLAGRMQNALVSYAAYTRKIFWPHDLSSFYPPRLSPIPLTTLLAAAALLVGITAIIVFFRQKRYPVAGWGWFLIALLPVSGIVQAGSVTMADRFTYVPGIGILVMTVWSAAELAEKPGLRRLRPLWSACPWPQDLASQAGTTCSIGMTA